MNKTCWRIALLALMLALLLSFGAAAAEETARQGTALLMKDGYLQATPPVTRSVARSTLEDAIVEQLESQAASIDVSAAGLNPDDFCVYYTNVLNKNPHLFFVGANYGYTYNPSTNCVMTLEPSYLYSGEDLENRTAAFNASVNSIASYARKASTTVGRLLRVNDYFCTHFEYDNSYSIYSPDQLFLQGTGVCQAYALAAKAVFDVLGIGNGYAVSDAMVHMWNMVSVNGSWYHLDITWNDPTYDMPLRARHEHFLRSDSGISGSGHYSWTGDGTASSTAYDSAFWIGIDSPLAVMGDSVYYMAASAANGVRPIMKWTPSGGSETFLNVDIAGADGSIMYSSAYSPVAADSSNLYYGARGSLFAYPLDGSGSPELIYSTDDSSCLLWSCYLNGSTVQMLVSANPNESYSIESVSTLQRCTLALEPQLVEITAGAAAQLTAVLTPACDAELLWCSSDESVVTVNADGLLTGVGPGAATVTVTAADTLSAECTVIVHGSELLQLPEDTQEIQAEAFSGAGATEVVIPAHITSIGDSAFANNPGLRLIRIPASVTHLGDGVFTGCTGLTILCPAGSAAEAYAQANGIPCLTVQ